MREHLTELLPLILVGVVLLAFQLTRESGPVLSFLPLQDHAPAASTPAAQVAPTATAAPRTRPVTIPTTTPSGGVCIAARPTFVGGLAALKASLGASMGDPLECERAVNDQGDTQQKTSTGLAYYRRDLNAACFTTGFDHWALPDGRLVHWTGDLVDPPSDAAPISP